MLFLAKQPGRMQWALALIAMASLAGGVDDYYSAANVLEILPAPPLTEGALAITAWRAY